MDLTEIPGADSFSRHPWEVVRARFFGEILAPLLLDEEAATMLDAGAGDGWFARRLAAQHPRLHVTCFDPGYEHRADGVHNEAERIDYVSTLPPGPFDVVTLLDVLEHVPDDAALLSSLTGVLRPGGYLLISVPAWPGLFSSHDVALGHQRRYRPQEALALLRDATLDPLRRGGLFHSLLVARAASLAVERARPGPNGRTHELKWRGGRTSARLVQAILRADTRFSRLAVAAHLQIPGLSWWALCQRPS